MCLMLTQELCLHLDWDNYPVAPVTLSADASATTGHTEQLMDPEDSDFVVDTFSLLLD